MTNERKGVIKRETRETRIETEFSLDGQGMVDVQSGVPFWIIC